MPPGPVPLAVAVGVKEPEIDDVAFVGDTTDSEIETPVVPIVPEMSTAVSVLATVDSNAVLVRTSELNAEVGGASNELVESTLTLTVLNGSEVSCADTNFKHV